MSPPTRESSAPSIDPFALGEVIGEVRASLKAIEAKLSVLPCVAHNESISKLSADIAAIHSRRGWLERNWRVAIPFVLALLSAPTVRQCVGEQRAAQAEAAIQRLEQRPATKVVVPVVMPTLPALAPAPKEETP